MTQTELLQLAQEHLDEFTERYIGNCQEIVNIATQGLAHSDMVLEVYFDLSNQGSPIMAKVRINPKPLY